MHRALAILTVIGTIASTSFSFVAARPAALSQGQAIDECRQALYPDGGADDYHKRPEIRACVERVEHGGPAVSAPGGASNFY